VIKEVELARKWILLLERVVEQGVVGVRKGF
jgi:hypothetical protein